MICTAIEQQCSPGSVVLPGHPAVALAGLDIISGMDVQGFEIGSGFSGSQMLGSTHNDEFYMDNGQVRTRTNRSGGVQGGIR